MKRLCANDACRRPLKGRGTPPICPACLEAAAPLRSARPGTRQVLVPYATSHSGVHLSAAVTLPAAPWEAQR